MPKVTKNTVKKEDIFLKKGDLIEEYVTGEIFLIVADNVNRKLSKVNLGSAWIDSSIGSADFYLKLPTGYRTIKSGSITLEVT